MLQAKQVLEVSLFTPEGLLFQGKACSIILPGEQGVFEVLPHHKPLMSRLFKGEILIDGRSIPIQRGLAKVVLNAVRAIVEIA